jgi:hypothetical protein
MNLKLHEGTLIMESPSPLNTYISFYIDYPERRLENDRHRSGFNVFAVCGDKLEEDLRGLYIYPGIEGNIIGVDMI